MLLDAANDDQDNEVIADGETPVVEMQNLMTDIQNRFGVEIFGERGDVFAEGGILLSTRTNEGIGLTPAGLAYCKAVKSRVISALS